MDVAVHEHPRALAERADEWRALAVEDPAATVFHLPEYAGVWWSELAGRRFVRLVEMRERGALAGIAALSLDPDGILRFFGDLETADYLGPVSRLSDRDAVAEALVETALRADGWSVWEMHGLAENSGWAEPLARAAKALGLEVEGRQQDVCPRIRLEGTYEQYLASLPGKPRHEIRRKARRLAAAGPWRVRAAVPETLDSDLERFFAMHRSSAGPKGKFLHEGMASFFTGLAASVQNFGRLRLHFLDLGGETVAGTFAFSWRGTWSVYNSAYDHARRDLAPGMVLVAETIRIATEEGCRVFDLLRGSEAYKYRFGACDGALVQLTACRGNNVGRPGVRESRRYTSP
ncbi:MAG: GNAT family N-acetyltransferase [Acidobacteria bacterium]|nr:GNAT family N-acetyltransferase [Acidobacteriota bacterium]